MYNQFQETVSTRNWFKKTVSMKRARDEWICLQCSTSIEDEDLFYFWPRETTSGYCHKCLLKICSEYITEVPERFRHAKQRQSNIDLDWGDEIPCESGDCWYRANMDRAPNLYEFSECCRNQNDDDMWLCDQCLEYEDLSTCPACLVRVTSVIYLTDETTQTWCTHCIESALSHWAKSPTDKKMHLQQLLDKESKDRASFIRNQEIHDLKEQILGRVNTQLKIMHDLPDKLFSETKLLMETHYLTWKPPNSLINLSTSQIAYIEKEKIQVDFLAFPSSGWEDRLFYSFGQDMDPKDVPKPYYILYNGLVESRGLSYRKHVFQKAARFTARKDFKQKVILTYELEWFKFYEQFTKEELESVGI